MHAFPLRLSSQTALHTAEYIVIITGRELQGNLMGHEVYRASDFEILPLNPTVNVQNPPHPVEAHLLALLRSHLNGGVFYFSYGWDMTRRLQAQYDSREKDADRALWEVVRCFLITSGQHIDSK